MSSPSPIPILSRDLYRERRPSSAPLPHHVLPSSYLSQLTSLLPLQDGPSVTPSQDPSPSDGREAPQAPPCPPQYLAPSSFKNPWRSWHKPTLNEVWRGLSWRGAAANAGSSDGATSLEGPQHHDHGADNKGISDGARGAVAARPSAPSSSSSPPAAPAPSDSLTIVKPDFSYPPTSSQGNKVAKVTWLGHASSLVQLPALQRDSEDGALRLLFDPIFSARCSPVQYFGPLRSYAPPCSLEDLPRVDLLFISHSHYDHQDLATLKRLWQLNGSHLGIFVPLGLKGWFVEAVKEWGVAGDDAEVQRRRMEQACMELDWWDEVELGGVGEGEARLRIVCTPAQHGSGRYGLDANTTLWSSWLVERIEPAASPSASHPGAGAAQGEKRFRVFFGGDTGFQFHEPSGSVPPTSANASRRGSTAPEGTRKSREDDGDVDSRSSMTLPKGSEESTTLLSSTTTATTTPTTTRYPTCPLFSQLSLLYGPPHLSLLPISVGATLSFLKSYDPLPEGLSLFPDIDEGLTGANHMRSRDAVRVLGALRMPGSEFEEEEGGEGEGEEEEGEGGKRWSRDDYLLEALPPHMASRLSAALKEAGKPSPPSSSFSSAAGSTSPRIMTAVAIHWGTFVSGPSEVDETLRSLRDACQEFGVGFARKGEGEGETGHEDAGKRDTFLALDHGGSHWVPLE